MPQLTWQEAVEVIKPYIVKILTPRSSGTGFFFSYAKNKSLCGIATAAHVIDHAYFWEEPIRFVHEASGKSIMKHNEDRAIIPDLKLDSAAVLIPSGELEFPAEPLPLSPEGKVLKVGNEVGWLGFPAVSSENLCLFSGRISCFLENQLAYLVDGVAIHGVSGGPAFHIPSSGPPIIMGIVSEYRPNRATGESLPGLCVLRDVMQLQELVKTFKTFDEAKTEESKKKEEETPPTEQPPSRDQPAGSTKEK